MSLTNFDLFGHPVAVPQNVTPPRRRVVSGLRIFRWTASLKTVIPTNHPSEFLVNERSSRGSLLGLELNRQGSTHARVCRKTSSGRYRHKASSSVGLKPSLR